MRKSITGQEVNILLFNPIPHFHILRELAGLQPITRRRAAGVVKALSFLHHHHTDMRNLHTGISSSRNTSFIPAPRSG